MRMPSMSPFIMSPGLSPTRNKGSIFFPTTITANGEAKVTSLNGISYGRSAHNKSSLPMDDSGSSDSPIIKVEEPQHCCVGED